MAKKSAPGDTTIRREKTTPKPRSARFKQTKAKTAGGGGKSFKQREARHSSDYKNPAKQKRAKAFRKRVKLDSSNSRRPAKRKEKDTAGGKKFEKHVKLNNDDFRKSVSKNNSTAENVEKPSSRKLEKKEQKKIIKGLKGNVMKVACDQYGSVVLLAILDTVDDTELLNKKLVEVCSSHTGELLQSPLGKDVIYEVAKGGSDDIMWNIITDGVSRVHKAIADLGAWPRGNSDSDQVSEEHVFEHYHSSRTIWRLILESTPSLEGIATSSFPLVFWKTALKGNCKQWANGHSQKIVSALLLC